MSVRESISFRILDAAPTYVLCGVVAAAPLPFGSNEPISVAIWCVALGVACGLLSLSLPRLRWQHLTLLGGFGIIVLFFSFVLHEQLADQPWVASPNPLWSRTSAVLDMAVAPSAAITRGEPLIAVGPPLASALALISGLIIASDRARARLLLQVIAWSGAVYAVYGILSFLFDPTTILWRAKRSYLGNLTGTFINRNTAATYFGSCSIVWFSILLEQIRSHLRMDKIQWAKVPARILSDTPRAMMFSFSALFICLMAMFLTGSRAGVGLSLFALIITFTIFFYRDLPPRSGIWVSVAGGVATALLLLQLMGGIVSTRFEIQGLADEGRIAAYQSTIEAIQQYPWFGTGLGTFAWTFPAYRSPDISMYGIWDAAHSTPLELASEVGLLLAGAIGLGWLVMFLVLGHGIRSRRRERIIPLSAFSVGLLAILHSCIDFSLQLPGYSIVVFALLGAGLAQSYRSETRLNATAPPLESKSL